MRSRGFADPKGQDKLRYSHRLRSISPVPLILLVTLWSRPTATSLWQGGIFVAVGELLRWWSAGYIGSLETSLAEEQLVTWGPYGLVRNPCYWGSFLTGLGLAIMSDWWLAFLLLAGFTLYAIRKIIPTEELLLGEQFGLAYEAYYQSVPRYIPGWQHLVSWVKTGRQGRHDGQQRFRSQDAWRAERYMIVFLIGVMLTMAIRWRFG